MSGIENEMELLQLQIQQLKSMIREKDEILQHKDKELQEANAKNSKLRLQAKAKAVKKSVDAKKGHDVQEIVEDSDTPSQHVNRAEVLLLKRKLEDKSRTVAEKDELIRVRENQLEAKERVMAERDALLHDMTNQLEEKTKAMETLQQAFGGGSGDEVSQMYAQMVYKDRRIMELNNKLLEQDKRVMDLQEFAGEKDEVIRGRDKVVQVLQNDIREKDQTVQDQALLITKLTSRVESTNEKLDLLTEQMRLKEQELKSETEKFHIKLTESQKYFEEMLSEMDAETKRLQTVINEKNLELSLRENDLVQLIGKHEKDLEAILKKENVNLQDHALHMMETKLKDVNEVLEAKLKVISILQAENAEKDRQLSESREAQRFLKEKLQVTSEQVLLLQANFVETETQWREEKLRYQTKLKDVVEKHEVELSEKAVQLESLHSRLSHFEAAYSQATEEYRRLQEHYNLSVAGKEREQSSDSVAVREEMTSSLNQQIEEYKATIEKLRQQVKELQSRSSGEESAGPTDSKLLKVKAQMTTKVKALEKQLAELKSSTSSNEVESWKNRVQELTEENKLIQQKLVEAEEQVSTLDELKAQIDELQTVIEMLHDQKAQLQEQLTGVQVENKQLEEQVKQLQSSVDLADEKRAEATLRQVETLMQEIEELKIQKDTEKKEKDQILEEHQQLVSKLTSELDRESTKLVKLENDCMTYEEKVSILEEKVKALESEQSHLMKVIDDKTIEAEAKKDIERENLDLKHKIDELSDMLSSQQNLSLTQKEEITALVDKVSNLEDQVKALPAEEIKVGLGCELDSTQSKCTAELDSCSTGISQERTQEENVELTSQIYQNLNQELSDKTLALEKATSEICELTDEIQSLKLRCTDFEFQVEQLSKELELVKDEASEQNRIVDERTLNLLNQMSELEAELANRNTVISQQQEKLTGLESSLLLSQQGLLSLQQAQEELSTSKKELSSLQTKLDEVTASEESLLEQGQKIKDQYNELVQERQDLQDERDSIKLELVSVQTQLSSANETLVELQSALHERDIELTHLRQTSEELQHKVKCLSLDLDSSSNQLLEFKSVNDTLREQLSSYQDNLATLTQSLETDTKQSVSLIQTLQDEKDISEQLVTSLQRQLVSLEAELSAARSAVAERNMQIALLTAAVTDEETKADGLVTALHKVQTDKTLLEKQVSSLTQSLAEMAQNYETSSDELNKKLVSLQDDYKVQELKMSELQIELISLQQKLLECQDSLQAVSLSKSILEETLRTRESDFTESLQNVQQQLEEEVQAKVNILAQNEKEKKELEGKANQLKSDYEHQITELMTELTNARQQAQLANNIVQTMQNSSSQKEQETMNELFSKSEEILVLQRQLEVSLKEQDKVKSDLEASLIEQGKVKSELEALLIEQGKVKSELEASLIEQGKVKSELEASLIERDKVKSELKESLMELDKIKSDIVLSEQLYSQTKTELELHFDQVRDFLHATLGLEECTLNDCWNALASTLTSMIAEKQYLTEQMVDLNHKLSSLEEDKKDGLQRSSEFQAREDEQSENERLCSNLKKRTEEFDLLQETFSQLEKQKREVEERYSSLQNEHVKLNDSYSSLQNEHVKLNDLYSSLQNEHVKLNDLYSTLQNEHVKLKDSYSTQQNEHVKLNDLYSSLQNEHSKFNEDHQRLQDQLVAIQKLESSPNLSETISQKDSELLTKESHPLTQSEDIQSLTQEMLTKIVTEKDSKIIFLLENMQEMEGRLIQLEEQNQSLVERHSSELDQVKQELISKEKAFQDKEMIAKKALATAKKLKFQFTQANKQLEEAKATIDKLSREKEDQLTLGKSRDAVDSQVKETHTSNDEQMIPETLQELVSQPNESVPTEVSSLQEEVSTYREYCVQLQQQVQSLTDNVFDSDAKVKKYQRDLEQLEGVKEGLKMTVSEVEASYLQLQQELEKAQADHIATKEAMEQRCVILEEQAGQWKSFIKNLEQELQAKDNRIQQMNEELHQLHNVHVEKTQFKLSLEGKEEELSSLLSELESKKEVLSKELNTSDQLRTLLREEQDRLTLSERALEDKNEELSQLRESITQQTTDFELKEQSLLSQISFLDHQIEDHKHQLVEMTALLDKTQLARDQAVSHADNLQQRIDHQQTEISELNQMIDSFRVQELKAREDKDEELKSLQAALAEFQHQVEDQRVQIDLLVSDDQVNDHNSISSQTIIDNLNQDIHSLKTQQEALESNYDLVLKEKLTLEEEHVRLKSELSGQLDIAKKMQGIVSDKLSQVEHIQSAYEKLESDFNRLSSERDHLVASIDSMRGEIEGLEQMIAESRLSESTAQEKVLKLQLERDQLKLELDKLKAKQALEKETVQHLESEGTQRDDLQRSPSAGKEPPAIASKLRACEAAYEKTKSQLQVAEVKCEKMLVKLKAFKDKNDKLQIQVDELQQQLAGNSPQRDSSLREERRRLEEQVISLNNKLRQIETYNGQLIFENTSIKTQLKKEQESENSYRSDLERSRAQCEALERQIVELKKELSDSALNFNTQIMDLTSKHDKEMAELKKEEELGKAVFSQEMSRLSEALDNARREAQLAMTAEVAKVKETLNVEISSLQGALEASRSDCANAVEERNTEQKNVITLNSELSNLKEEISKLNSQLEIAEVKALESETRVLKMKEELLEEERVRQVRVEGQEEVEHTELTSLKSQLETLQSQYTTLSHDNDSYQALVTSLTSSNAALKQECEQLRFKSKDSKSVQETDRLRQLLTEVEQERDELREEFEGVREELVELRREKVSLTQQLSELTTTVQQLTDKIVNLESLRSAQTPLNIEDNVKVERVLPLGQGVNITETEGIESKLSDLKEELSAALKENHQLKATVSGLNWKLEEACNLEQEVEDLQTELSSSNMEKKILSHDLEEVRGEMSALQTDKHLLMKEVERLSEIVDGQDRKGSGDGRPTKVQRSASEEVLQFLAAKDAEISQIQSLLDDQSKQVLTGLKEIELREGIIVEKDEQISMLQKEVLFLQMNLKELELKNSSLTAELKTADRELTKRLEHFNLKLDTVKSLEADFDSLNVDFNTVLEEKRDMAKEIEDLHNKIGQLMTQQQEVTFNQEQQGHVLREKEALQRRVVELETTEGSFLLENARLKQEVDRLRAVLQQAEFVKESLSSHQDSGVGGSLSKVQAQFSEVVEERNRIMIQLNDAEHRLKQREARCQQLAMQVSQLAEDRGYLNSQLANISKSLREKEQEWIAIRQQYGELYQAYIAVQSKTAELERRIALDSVQKELEEEETAAEADQVKGQTDQALKRIEELQSMYSNLEESHSALSTSLVRERTLREQLERELGEAQEQIKLLAAGENREVYLQLEEDNEMRIRETSTMLTRHGMGYCSRVHSWLKVKNRQLTRVMRLRPGLRTIIWIYFAFLHFLLIGCFSGFL